MASSALDREEAVRKLEGLVRQIAKKFAYGTRHSGGHYSDYVQEGMCGALTALERFDPDQGTKLSTYAYSYIVASMQQYAEKFSSAVHVGHSYFERRRRLQKLLGEAGEPATIAIPGAPWEGQFFASNDASTIPEPQEYLGIDQLLDRARLVGALNEALVFLPPKQRYVILGLYFEQRTLAAVGLDLKVTRERVRQIKLLAFTKLRKLLAVAHLETM
jgi:RNA polymerase sigma factor (sigma-70 family)